MAWLTGAALLILLATVVLSYQDWVLFREASADAEHAREVLDSTETLLSSMRDAETGQRGFLLTGDAKYLQPYHDAVNAIPDELKRLTALVVERPRQAAAAAQLEPLISSKLAELRETIQVAQERGPAAAIAIVRQGHGKLMMDQIRSLGHSITGAESVELARRRSLFESSGQRTRLLTAFGSAVLFVLIVLSAATILAEAKRRERLIDDLQASEKRTAEVRDLLETTLSSIGDAVIATGLDGKVTFINPVAQALTQYTREEAAGRPLSEMLRIVNENTREEVESPVTKVLRENAVIGLGNRVVLLARNGAEIPIDDSGAPIRDHHGAVIGVALVFRDITERKKADDEIRRLASIVASSADGILSQGLDGVITSWNAAATSMTGYGESEMVGGSLSVMTLDGSPDPEGVIGRIRNGEPAVHYEAVRVRKDGGRIAIASVASPIRDGSGKIIGVSRNWRDVSELKQARAKLRESEEHLRLSAEAGQIGAWSFDVASGAVRWSPQLERLYGLQPGEFRGTREHFFELVHPDDRQAVRDAASRATREGKEFEVEYRLARAPGEVRWLLSRGKAIHSEGKTVTVAGVTMDVTGRRRLEEKLRQSQKLESLGILAGGIAHDFNNLLVGILANASVLLEDTPPDSPQHEVIENLMQASERATHLTRQMLAYSGKGRFVIERLNLSQQVSDILTIVGASVPKNVRIVLNIEPNLPQIEGDAGQIQQLIMNLVINAAEAIGPDGGAVTITTSQREIGRDYVRDNLAGDTIAPGVYVVLEVHDNGIGMDAATQARIFDPFFTTKFTGRGLGLAAALGIVRGHKGALTVYSAPGMGSTFKILLPAAPAQSVAAAAQAPASDFRGEGTILVIDDEDLVRRTLKTALERYGYQVLTAAGGEEALEKVEWKKPLVSLALLDMTMPGMSGEETLRHLQELRPDLPVIATSGYNEAEALRRFGGGLSGFIQKPYTPRRLAEKIRDVLRRGSSRAAV